ncbi:uncharacterized protein LOC119279568 [Triticum dicoccoides]|uniref:uncharacterized protein LOC119279568 n=1 Tax=Triticum dicoccoides TaxID=85692 RepID=UPI00188FEB46|nr:uncharacterized protein LOC119279568 [Triticum dicoccoides]
MAPHLHHGILARQAPRSVSRQAASWQDLLPRFHQSSFASPPCLLSQPLSSYSNLRQVCVGLAVPCGKCESLILLAACSPRPQELLNCERCARLMPSSMLVSVQWIPKKKKLRLGDESASCTVVPRAVNDPDHWYHCFPTSRLPCCPSLRPHHCRLSAHFPVLNRLLKLFDDNWAPIKDKSYNILVDTTRWQKQ